MAKLRITVAKRELYPDLVEAYGSPSMKERGLPRCQTFEDGQVFEIEGSLVIPDGFCSWAWADLLCDDALWPARLLEGQTVPRLLHGRLPAGRVQDGARFR
ncbi:hypothetical protein ACFLSZ_06135 [Candidatus Bipolaricaulota bacterium]